MEAAATPFPREETTPPVTKINFDPIRECYARERTDRAKLFLPPAIDVQRHFREKTATCQFASTTGGASLSGTRLLDTTEIDWERAGGKARF